MKRSLLLLKISNLVAELLERRQRCAKGETGLRRESSRAGYRDINIHTHIFLGEGDDMEMAMVNGSEMKSQRSVILP